MFTLILLGLLLILIESIHFLYLFQIKEYRMDRLSSMLREKGLLNVFYSFHFRLPSKSSRNIFIFICIIATCFFFLLISLEDSTFYMFFTFSIFYSPFIAFGLVFVGVMITNVPVFFYRQWLILRAKIKVKYSSAMWIGITGSYGKTSVKEFLYEILSTEFKTAKTHANFNSDIGIAISILNNLKKNTEYFITEFGAYKKGEIQRASSYIPLSYVVVTGLGNQHLDLYGSVQNLIDEETYLAYTLNNSGQILFPDDLPEHSLRLKDIHAKKISYGLKESSTIQAKILPRGYEYQKAHIKYKNYSFPIQTKLLGIHTIQNLLPAIAIGIELGINPKKIQEKIESLEPIIGKLSLHKGKNSATIINDAANSNVEGFIAAIQTLNSLPQKSKIIISQGIIELGVEKTDSYKKIIRELLKTTIFLYTTDKLFQDLVDKKDQERVQTFNDVGLIKKNILSKIQGNTAILLEGKFSKPFIDSLL